MSWDLTSSVFIPMVFIFLLSLILGFKQNNIFLVFAGLASAAVSLTTVRLTTLFAIIFLPAVAANFNGIFCYAKNYLREKWPKPTKVLSYVLIVAIIGVFPYKVLSMDKSSVERGYVNDRGIGLDAHSNGAGNFFKENNLKGPIFDDYDIGGYILYHLFPSEKVFVDNNGADSYSVNFFDNIYTPALSQEEKWLEAESKYKINAIFISQRDGSPAVGNFLWNRLHDSSWALVYADTYAVILLKNVPANAEVINKFQITKENILEKISAMLNGDPMEKMVAGRLLYLIGREDLAISSLKKVAAKYPKNSWIWYYMGVIKVMKNDLPNAISAAIFLENALKMGEQTADGYIYLGLAYIKTSQFSKAEEAFRKAMWLNPARQDAQEYLNSMQEYLEN
jgi:tetratricopeptide (TPR) repeat protein